MGTAGSPGQARTATTGTHNMLAVAYGDVLVSNGSLTTRGSDNYTVVRNSVGNYTLTFTAASGLSSASANMFIMVDFIPANGQLGFIRSGSGGTSGTVSFITNNTSGTLADLALNFVVYVR